MTTAPAGNARTQSPAANLFATRAQQEEQSRRVPINQLAQSSTTTFTSQQTAAASLQQQQQLPTPLMPGTGWQQPTATVTIPTQPNPYPPVGVAPYPQSQNPFLWSVCWTTNDVIKLTNEPTTVLKQLLPVDLITTRWLRDTSTLHCVLFLSPLCK